MKEITEMKIKIICEECGDESRNNIISLNTIRISPCEKCLKKYYNAGYDFAETLSKGEIDE